MKLRLFSYNQLDTFVHRLSGFTKLACFLLLTNAVMLTYDTRVIFGISVFAFIIVSFAKLPFKKLAPMLAYVAAFLIFNFVLTFFVAPNLGSDAYGSSTVLFKLFGKMDVTAEQLFYQITKTMKYFAAIPIGFCFVLTTNPSEFASSLNRIKIPYQACTALSLTLRYFPDVQKDFFEISYAQQARGLDNSRKTKFIKRISNTAKILIPLVFSTLDRTDSITNAMELRGYGKAKTRTWYSSKPLNKADYIAIVVSCVILFVSLFMRFAVTKSMYWYPF